MCIRDRVTGRECPSIILCNATCYHLSAAESAVMHIMWVFPDTTEGRYDTPSIGCDAIIVRSLLCTWLKSEHIKTEPEPCFLFKKNDRNLLQIRKWKPSQHYMILYHYILTRIMEVETTKWHTWAIYGCMVTGKSLGLPHRLYACDNCCWESSRASV